MKCPADTSESAASNVTEKSITVIHFYQINRWIKGTKKKKEKKRTPPPLNEPMGHIGHQM